jgi:hypothetical protein
MKTNVSETSISAYYQHQQEGKVGAQANAIFGKMQVGKDYSRRELSKITNIELNSICGRVAELLAVGLIKESQKRKCSQTGKTISPVYKEFTDSLF